ncbi:HD domain-containing protein [Rubellimicrobium roseum]|uniref:Bifunctional (P)ppGpp synthetase/guanosine-3',5'-bis(Diphosphate) 3'-pyrophosphohydrolase n=1 Tax=Rubellimicrobium roseum TaxID=687525 RepID=A0A5C4NB33_9RHOB|nr:HD domain-containing protein [Rubellimicrobium roseum]TNC72001.1 bifunctional (p)ppGpp synthetase/guanosine-3',5'-bis(diphosphate) 3'-pyrophosphohydrolase [Rubellimicrobium roseum]
MTDPENLRRIAAAFNLAAQAHTGQTRKGAAAEPYVNHVADVAARLAQSPAVTDDLLIAAILHDVVEDTAHSLDEIIQRFGPEVAGYVAEVTDDMSLPDAERKRRQVEEAPRKSDGAKRIKLADKASNIAALADSPPHFWDRARKRRYLEWAREVVAGLRGVDPLLEGAFDRESTRAESVLDD